MSFLKNAGKVACGFLLGTVGVKALTSIDAKKAYTQVVARAFRCVDEMTKTATIVKENCDDIVADAKEINEDIYEEERKRRIADAKEVIKEAEEAAEAKEA